MDIVQESQFPSRRLAGLCSTASGNSTPRFYNRIEATVAPYGGFTGISTILGRRKIRPWRGSPQLRGTFSAYSTPFSTFAISISMQEIFDVYSVQAVVQEYKVYKTDSVYQNHPSIYNLKWSFPDYSSNSDWPSLDLVYLLLLPRHPLFSSLIHHLLPVFELRSCNQ